MENFVEEFEETLPLEEDGTKNRQRAQRSKNREWFKLQNLKILKELLII